MPRPTTNPVITWIYQSEDLDPAGVEAFERGITRRYSALSRPRGLDFRVISATELVPSCVGGRPVLRHGDEDLLERRQCFIVEDMATDPQGLQALRAVYRTIEASDSVLLNRSYTGPDYLERDKLAQLQHAAGLGIRTADTVAVPPGRYARRVLGEVRRALGEGPYIVKPRELTGGYGVLRVDSEQQLGAVIDVVAQAVGGYLVQPLIPHTGDMRVFMADGEVVSSLTRRPRPGGYLASVSQGGSVEVNLDHDRVADQCARIARDLRAEWICVDWLMTDSGPVLNEWSTAHGGFTVMPEPELGRVADAFFGWIGRRFEGKPPGR
ncbi:RimK family alpha-L-glutamate ligase [Kitasatospora sp. NPDC058063]|uniref:ATP-grasp domain-containing protein n=1 Tax=unclassified Kitasatospora TaxID=2633591 RepID=UPI0036D8B9E0